MRIREAWRDRISWILLRERPEASHGASLAPVILFRFLYSHAVCRRNPAGSRIRAILRKPHQVQEVLSPLARVILLPPFAGQPRFLFFLFVGVRAEGE